MKKTAKNQTTTNQINSGVVIILLVLLFAAIVLLTQNKTKNLTATPTPTETIENKEDLNKASSDLNSTNVDSEINTGITEVSTQLQY